MTVVWALTWLGQSAALAALTAVFVRLPACRARAAARHVAWTVALILCVGLLVWPLLPAAAPVAAPVPVSGAAGIHAAASSALIVLPAPVIRLSWWLGWAWALGTAAGLALTARDVWRVVRLKRRTVPLTAEEHAQLGVRLSARTSSRAPRLVWCDQLDSPAVLGFFSPVIALPRSQVSGLPGAQPHLVVLHELAHVRRGDDWWALAERIILALTWVNPVAHVMLRELSLSREMACDEWVVRQTAAPTAYAKCLADVAVHATHARRLRMVAGVTGRPGTLRRRIVGVLALDGRRPTHAMGIAAWLAPVGVFAVAAWLLQLPPVFVVERTAEAAVPEPARSSPAATAVRVSVEHPSDWREAGSQPGEERRSASRRPSGVLARATSPAVPFGFVTPAPAAPDTVAEHAEAVESMPLGATPLSGAGAPGVTVAAPIPGTFPSEAGAARWWNGPAAIGEATGGAAANAGRTTASFVARLGSHASQLFNR